MSKIGPKEAARRLLRERQRRPLAHVKPVRGGVEAKAGPEVPQRRAKAAVLCAPDGTCAYCDARRALSRLLMRRLRERRTGG